MSKLFSPLAIRQTTFKNRIFVSPMCQYSCVDGLPNSWHLVHLGARAVGGAAMVMTEAAAVSPAGRISPEDAGIWNDAQRDAWQPIAAFIRANGAVPAMQLAHAGRKASSYAPWRSVQGGRVEERDGGWPVLGAGNEPFSASYATPHEMTVDEIRATIDDFAAGAQRALDAGFEVIEVHAAHGYLAHQFLSPLVNHRIDQYGGSLENRMRFAIEISDAVRAVWPKEKPVLVRLSATDWAEGGWDLPQSIELSKALKSIGVDMIDVSSGGAVANAKMDIRPGYQVPFARAIRQQAAIATGAVGLITEAVQAEQIVADGDADAVFLARALLRDPYWPYHAAAALGVAVEWPDQYQRAAVNAFGK